MALYGYIEGRSDGLGITDKVILKCECINECELEVNKYTDEINVDNVDGSSELVPFNEYSFVFKSNERYNTLNAFQALKIKLKKIWYIILGKDYTYYDVIVDEKAMKKFIDALHNLVDGKSELK